MLSAISDAAYPLLGRRALANRANFFVYRDADSGFNHGFPSGLFANETATISKIHIDTAAIDDPASTTGTATNPNRLDRARGTVMRVSFDPLTTDQFAGVNIEEPENGGATGLGIGYDIRGATRLLFDIRTPTRGGANVQFGVGGHTTGFVHIPRSPTYTTMSIALNSLRLSSRDRSNVRTLFSIGTNDDNAPDGASVLLDNIRFDPVPTSRTRTLSFPTGTETFGVVPLRESASGRIPIPADQLLRNVTTTYESAIALIALIRRGRSADLAAARQIANAFDYALHHDNHGDPIPATSGGAVGLHNGYSDGDLSLFNRQQPPKAGRRGDVRLAGFSFGASETGFALVLDGATGGNNAFAILALLDAYRRFDDSRFLADARIIGDWIAGNLADRSGKGFGGYSNGYPDEGAPPPKPLQKGKSVENNADIFAAFSKLAKIERVLGNTDRADRWTSRARFAGDFVIRMFDRARGRFNAGTVPAGTPASAGIDPTGERRGDDVINTFDFLDSNSFTALAMAGSAAYRDRIDWRRPVRYVRDHFAQTITVGDRTFRGFNIVRRPTAGPNGIAWEFTGQVVELMNYVDRIRGETRFRDTAHKYLNHIRRAQTSAPFGDRAGVVASTLQNGDRLNPIDQSLSTPFQDIPERVGLAATTWAVFADLDINPLAP